MNKTLATLTLILLSVNTFNAVAQTTPTPSANPATAAHSVAPNADTSTTAVHRTTSKFKKLDTNNDGFISREEAASRPGLTKNFDTIDTNKDGKLSIEEVTAYSQMRKSQHRRQPSAENAVPKP